MIPFRNSLNLSITLKGRFSSFLLTSSTVTRSSEQQESIVSPRDKIGLTVRNLVQIWEGSPSCNNMEARLIIIIEGRISYQLELQNK